MTGTQIKTLAQKKIGTSTGSIDWDALFAIVIDEIFGLKPWKFARQEMNYIHPQSTFEYTMDHTTQEKALNKIAACWMTTSYTLIGGVPIPVSDSATNLIYYPYADFINDFPDHVTDGDPQYYTILYENDGTNGMQIGIYPRPNTDAAVWVWGDFIPSYTIDGSQVAILPKQFHRSILYGLIAEAAEEVGKEALSAKHLRKFEKVMGQLDNWDRMNPGYKPRFKPYTDGLDRRGPRLPSNYPVQWSR